MNCGGSRGLPTISSGSVREDQILVNPGENSDILTRFSDVFAKGGSSVNCGGSGGLPTTDSGQDSVNPSENSDISTRFSEVFG